MPQCLVGVGGHDWGSPQPQQMGVAIICHHMASYGIILHVKIQIYRNLEVNIYYNAKNITNGPVCCVFCCKQLRYLSK